MNATTTLKATFWHATIEEIPQAGDPDFVSIALNTGGGRVWRNGEATPTAKGAIAMQPFEGADWRFEPPVTFVHLYVPFSLISTVCQNLFDRELAHADLRMGSGITDETLCGTAQSIRQRLASIDPTNLILDSWALILSEILVRRFTSHAQRPVRGTSGKIPARSIAHVIDLIEAHIDQDLSLAALADVAAMSVYHFARQFKETVGASPHAYVLSRRVRRAEDMLKRGGSSLADVAAACGFASQAHFTTAFGRHIGVTPGDYRRMIAL